MTDPPYRLTAALADRYRIERRLGEGGMATVFLAEDLRHQRRVAVKVMKPELAVAIGAERFLTEIRTTADLRHPHVLPLFDSGEDACFLWYAMPYVEGESLRDRLDREKQLPVQEALSIAAEIAGALDYAHGRGVIHRDVKPDNILLEAGHAVLADFGVARALSTAGSDRITQTGTSIGTPAYMSPEQGSGDDGVDGRSDLYSLGCVLYEMLTGRPPFTGATAQSIWRQHLVTEPTPATDLRPGIPAEVADSLERALAKSPADRFPRGSAFVEALSSGGAAATAPTPPRARSWPLRLTLGAAGLLVLVTLVWLATRGTEGRGPGADIERIAVLPMENQTGDPAQAFFVAGMTREVISVLTEAEVRVLGFRAVEPYAGSALTAEEIARELQVDAIVTGTVLQAGQTIQVAAELTDPSTNENLWSTTFSRPAPDVVTLQHEIAREIALGVRSRLSPDQERVFEAAPQVDPRAYAHYLLGQEELNIRTVESIRRSVDYLERSLEADPDFGPAWATLALANTMGFFYGAIPADTAQAAIGPAAERALELDPGLGDALIARGLTRYFLDWDFDGADTDLRAGMARNPTLLAQAFYTYFPWGTAQPAEATRAIERVLEAEPTTAQWQADAAWIRWAAGDSAAARSYALRAIELDSTLPEPNQILAFLDAEAGRISEAERWVARAEQRSPEYPMHVALEGFIRARAGDDAGARRLLDHSRGGIPLTYQALIYAGLGDKDAMYRRFEQAVDAREAQVLWIPNTVPALQRMRSEPRYQSLLQRMGLPEELRR
jgi:serine/threonine-protein kinase